MKQFYLSNSICYDHSKTEVHHSEIHLTRPYFYKRFSYKH